MIYTDPSGMGCYYQNGTLIGCDGDGKTRTEGNNLYFTPEKGATPLIYDLNKLEARTEISDRACNCKPIPTEGQFLKALFQLQLFSFATAISGGAPSLVVATGEAVTFANQSQSRSGNGPSVVGSIQADRQYAVREAWRQEAELVRRTGQGTRDWTSGEMKELLDTGRVRGYEGHHINDVNNNPHIARDPDNIRFVRGRAGNLSEHGGNFKNPSSGPFIRRK